MTTIRPDPAGGAPRPAGHGSAVTHAHSRPAASRPAARPRVVEPPAGQPISGGFLDPLTDEQKRDISRRLAEMFPFADPDDFWAKEIRPCEQCTDGISSPHPSSPHPSSQPEEG